MSEVYLTLTQGGLGGFQKLVAVKLLRRDLAKDEDFRRMFLEEARLTARLNHPNVVQTNDVGEDQGRYYIAMEYLEGQTFERIRRARNASKLFPVNMQIQMLVQALAGLHYAHELTEYDNTPLGIVHRDVTPSNIFVTYDGQVKLVDFGIAKVFDSLNHTRVGVLKGKARYMAPEQITGVTIDRRADIFSVGVMLWEILSGAQIWLGRSETEILRRVSAGDVPLPPRDSPYVLQQICTKAMAFHADDRYPTAEALRIELDAYLAQHMTPTRDRGLGPAVVELFRDERAQIRQVIETQMRGSRPGVGEPLPALHDVGQRRTGELPFGALNTPTAATAASPAGVRTSQSIQLTYGGQPAADAAAAVAMSRRRLGFIAGGAALVAILALFAFTRGHGGQNASNAGSDATDKAKPATPAPAASTVATSSGKTVAPVAHGVTDDTITLGMSAAFSGASRELGNRMKLGLDTAFAAANEAGGIAGRAVKLLALDDGYEGKRALANVQELITDRNVFAIIGNVGTPTTKEALPYVLGKKVLFFGAFTGSGILRRDPPDRYVFNYRASYEDETAKMVNYLIDVKKVPDHGIVVFAQHDSYGDAGFDGATKMLRKKGRSDDVLRVGYERNTLDVDDAVNKIVEYNNATVRLGPNDIGRKHPVKAIVMVGTYKASAKFIQKIHERKIDAVLLNVSFVGSSSLAEELKDIGGGAGFGAGVIVTQVVPHYDSGATGIIKYREALKKYHPDQQPDFISLEGYIVGQLFMEGLRRVGRDLDTEKLIDTLERVQDYDPGTGSSLSFSMSQHQATHKVWGTMLDESGAFKSIDME